ncbi:MAG: malto-oligosyltrehalose synthase, partial [Chthoniobacterales bacterium]
FAKGNYLPLTVSGTHAESVVAFARARENQWVVVVVPRLSSRVGFPPIGERWQDTAIELPQAATEREGRHLFTGSELRIESGVLKVATAMEQLPFAVYSL